MPCHAMPASQPANPCRFQYNRLGPFHSHTITHSLTDSLTHPKLAALDQNVERGGVPVLRRPRERRSQEELQPWLFLRADGLLMLLLLLLLLLLSLIHI